MAWRHRALLTLIAGWSAGHAAAYPVPVDFQGKLLRWDVSRDAPEVPYEVTGEAGDVAELAPIVGEATKLWNDVPGSFVRLVPADADRPARVTFHLARAYGGGAESAGYAQFDEYDGEKPAHCQIEAALDDGVSVHSFAKTALHELGHCLGLGHTLIPTAIMSYYLDQNDFALDVDDRAAVARLYPADGSQPKLPPGCAIGDARAASGSPWAVGALLLAPLAVAGARRRRKGESPRP